ncbi:MAG: M20/M25/M40 family metallo-hydrolase [Anaerolineales bacterium]|nr:M20/M25/M40 family metallo-hydrolase [Anaerolineales bacterium]
MTANTTPEFKQQLNAFFENQMPAYMQLLRDMVAINSFTANPFGVNKLGKMTAEVFAPLGFSSETVQSVHAMYGRHLILTRPSKNQAAPKIGLVSHLDTVFPPDEEERNDFRWRQEGDRIYGPGVVDIKGGTIMIYMLLSAVQTFAPDIFDAVTWVVLLDANEETGGRDFGKLCVQHLGEDALACLVFEPGNWEKDGNKFHLVASRKGMAVYRLTVDGRAAHAGSAHEEGANAVLQMAEVIQRICGFTDYGRFLTFNVGTVAGGTVINRVPHFASASVEMRAFDEAVFTEGLANMVALDGLSTVQSADGTYACRVNVEVYTKVAPWPRNAANLRLIDIWHEAGAACGYVIVPEDRGGLSDGNFIWHMIPTLDGLGPAGGNAHCSERSEDGSKEQEYVLQSSFVPKAVLNTMSILKLIGSNC